ncbi:hypothetical protein MNBD_GAMMA09-3635 [hydrothermal vent metagenome]|uniref:Membrane protein insertion efficiency factor YidD n=1 Tax=hydrothermal vent metagenome TaxID=652676 RepID=A0A3B0Y549_9ZZZZ
MESVLKTLPLLLIRLYQKYLSPRKGYCCAYGVLYQNGSCSERVSSIIQKHGLITGWSKIKNQFILCTEAYEKIRRLDKYKRNKKSKDEFKFDCCDPSSCEVINCIPIPKNICKAGGSIVDAGSNLPCDCSF